MKLYKKIFILLMLLAGAGLWAQEGDKETGATEDTEKTKKEKVADYKMDEVSITATRVKRKTQDVPASIKVVDKEEIEESKMLNIKDALMGTAGVQIDSKNSGSDSRVVIRGAGAKARYGIREIMFLLNGVPITDPDGFSKLDLLDPFQIDRIEVVKGPNSTLWGVNAAGGIVHIITKDPMKESGGAARLSYGQYGAADASVYYGNSIGESFVYSVNGSYRRSDNSWRPWNEFEAYNFTIQPGLIFKDGSTWQNYLTFNKSDIQLPGTVDEAGYEKFKDGGDAPATTSVWDKSGRYSTSLFYSTKYTKEAGSFTFKPMFFLNKWEHYHPVYALIGIADALSLGGDIQVDQKHIFGPVKGTLTFGVTGRMEKQDSEKYQYRDIETAVESIPYPPFSRTVITGVSSDEKGEKASEKESNTQLVGAFIQESLNIARDLTVDLGMRYDQVDFNIDGHIDSYYSYASENYADCDASDTDCGQPVENNEYKIEKTFKSVSPRTGVSYRIIKALSVYGSVAKGIQTPTDSEMDSNPDLDLVTMVNYEGGFKGRGKIWDFDINVFQADLENEVVSVKVGTDTEYRNAGKTRKRGVEFSGSLDVLKPLTLGGSFTFNDFKYVEYTELIRNGASYEAFDRSGNYITYAPRYLYSGYMRLKFKNGFKAKIQTDTWGPYYVDAANSEKYDGYSLITSLMIGYEFNNLTFMVNADNIFDTRYAVEVQKTSTVDNTGDKSYSLGTPRSILFSLRYKF